VGHVRAQRPGRALAAVLVDDLLAAGRPG